MNTHIRDNLDALKEPPSDHSELDQADFTTNSTTFANVDGTDTEGILRHTLDTGGGDIFCGFNGMVGHNAGATGSVTFNLTVDGTAVALNDGISGWYTNNASLIVPMCFVYLIPASSVSAGTHIFRLQWKVNSASITATLYAGNGTAGRDIHPQFWVRELS